MIVLLDMDGVIADFNVAALIAFGFTESEAKKRVENWTPGVWSVEDEIGREKGELWKVIANNKRFWEDIPIYNYTKKFIKELKSNHDVYICTSPSPHHDCPTGKLKWLSNHNLGLSRNVVITKHKHLLACPNKCLIDDTDTKINKFVEHGGNGVLFPQRWNTMHSFDGNKVDYVLSEIDRIANGR